MGKVEVNKQRKESSLLNTAFDFFTTKGFSKTSISDIVAKAGVAKGTFYLYFKDKYDIRNRLITHKSSQLFRQAALELEQSPDAGSLSFEDKLIRIADSIIGQLSENQALLNFISKNLSWGVFKTALTNPVTEDDVNFYDLYRRMLEEAPHGIDDPEIMLFLIVELISGACYSSILYQEPCSIDELKPRLYKAIRLIIREHERES
ncbi:MAG: TetR/AcrR family transcriptional regulator [Oscillospiraceae bacterium]|nr:TetR/AcrR family transcriptional regulator [Oscillospiraceae bacterium]